MCSVVGMVSARVADHPQKVLSVESGAASCHSRGMIAPLPLANLLVVSLEQAVAAPYCSSRLADAGARVIKIERAEGDFARGYDRRRTACPAISSGSTAASKAWSPTSSDPSDAALLHRILDRADVFIQNLAPGAAARAGFGSDELRERYPRLITVDISGYGDTGDYATMKAYDLLVQAESGLAMITGHPAGQAASAFRPATSPAAWPRTPACWRH